MKAIMKYPSGKKLEILWMNFEPKWRQLTFEDLGGDVI